MDLAFTPPQYSSTSWLTLLNDWSTYWSGYSFFSLVLAGSAANYTHYYHPFQYPNILVRWCEVPNPIIKNSMEKWFENASSFVVTSLCQAKTQTFQKVTSSFSPISTIMGSFEPLLGVWTSCGLHELHKTSRVWYLCRWIDGHAVLWNKKAARSERCGDEPNLCRRKSFGRLCSALISYTWTHHIDTRMDESPWMWDSLCRR